MAPHPPLPPTPTLRTERLILRPLVLGDAPAVQRLFPQWEVVRHLNPVVPWPYPHDGAITNLKECLQERRGEKLHWAITLKDGPGDLRGRIDLWPDDGDAQDMRSFWLDPALQGHGLMTEAAERVTAYAFEEMGWPHLYLTNAEANLASHRIKEKQGATIVSRTAARFRGGDGVRVTWILTREAWLKARSS
jgi:[ribosomal protein S5]-alanine N-acetyltransferase